MVGSPLRLRRFTLSFDNQEPKFSDSWMRLMLFCQSEFTEGELRIKIAAGQPTELVEAKRRIRFDKGAIPAYSSNILEQSTQ